MCQAVCVFQKRNIQRGKTILAEPPNIQYLSPQCPLSLYSRLMPPNKRTKYIVCEKEDVVTLGVRWSIMKTVWHYSNCSQPLYLYFLDNAMCGWSKDEVGVEIHRIVLKSALIGKSALMIEYEQSLCCDMNGGKHLGTDLVTKKFIWTVFTSCPLQNQVLHEDKKKPSLVLCVSFNDIIYDYKGGNVLMGHLKKANRG